MKQGQVEINMSQPIYDYSNTVLVHRNVVEELNTTIRSLGESKILSMVESKDFRKGIVQVRRVRHCAIYIAQVTDKREDTPRCALTTAIRPTRARFEQKEEEISHVDESQTV